MTILKSAAFVVLSVISAAPPYAIAQSAYPSKPVQLIVPFAASGSTTLTLRLIAPLVSENLGQQVMIVNRPGGNSVIGTASVASAAPDGYTIGAATSSLTINESMLPSSEVPYRASDFQAVTPLFNMPLVLTVSSQTGIKTFAELVQRAKANPGKLNYGSAGVGSTGHLGGSFLEMVAGVRATHVPFGSAGPVAAVAGGEIDFLMAAIPSAMTFIQQGRMVPLGIADLRRAKALPNVPTFDEQGLKGFQLADWTGIVAPRNTPPAIVERLAAAFQAAVSNEEVAAKINAAGVDVWKLNSGEFRKYIDADVDKWKEVTTFIKSRESR